MKIGHDWRIGTMEIDPQLWTNPSTTYYQKPKRRLFELLKEQGIRMNSR
jgi:hypothetical protein